MPECGQPATRWFWLGRWPSLHVSAPVLEARVPLGVLSGPSLEGLRGLGGGAGPQSSCGGGSTPRGPAVRAPTRARPGHAGPGPQTGKRSPDEAWLAEERGQSQVRPGPQQGLKALPLLDTVLTGD